jgi:acyl-CoA thioesterase
MSTPDVPLHRALALRTVGDGVLSADIAEGWDVRGIPHGGYLLALTAEAMRSVVPQPHPLTVSATYLAAPSFGPAELHVEIVRLGKRQSTASVRLVQDGLERVRALGTFAQLPTSMPEYPAGPVPFPDMPGPDDCLARFNEAAEEPVRFHDQLSLRLAPDTGWMEGRPSGTAELNGWMELVDGSAPDPAALLVFSDGMPPSMFESHGREIGHVPTIQITTHLFAFPSPGWVLGQFRTRVLNGSFVNEDGDLWDSAGHLVATTRQMALLIPPR